MVSMCRLHQSFLVDMGTRSTATRLCFHVSAQVSGQLCMVLQYLLRRGHTSGSVQLDMAVRLHINRLIPRTTESLQNVACILQLKRLFYMALHPGAGPRSVENNILHLCDFLLFPSLSQLSCCTGTASGRSTTGRRSTRWPSTTSSTH